MVHFLSMGTRVFNPMKCGGVETVSCALRFVSLGWWDLLIFLFAGVG